MDVQSSSQLDPGKLEQIVHQFRLKSLHIILDSRIPSLRRHGHGGDLSGVRRTDRWFTLVLGERPAALENLNFWHRNRKDPMIIDVILVHGGPNSSSVDDMYTGSSMGTAVETVIERWIVQYDTPRILAPQVAESSAYYKKTYKKLVILLRSLYSQMRLLPAYRLFRQLSSSSQAYNFDIIYKVSSFNDPFSREQEEVMKEYIFPPVEAYPGHICVSVTYHSTLSDFNLHPSTSLPTRIIPDYVGSPTTDPLKYFPSVEKGVRPLYSPLRGGRPSSLPSQHPHSWTSGFHRGSSFVQSQPLSGSPPIHRMSNNPQNFPSPPNDFSGNRIPNYRPLSNQKATSYDEYQLSPSFSPSVSPSPPKYLFGNNPVQYHRHPESAPVTIPPPMVGRSSGYLLPNFSDSNRHSLPPFSPKSTKQHPSSHESSSGSRFLRKPESSRDGEVHPGITIQTTRQKVSRDDSGRFSGLLSSSGSPRIGLSGSSGRLSYQDDCDFSGPFNLDDIDTSEFQNSWNYEGKTTSELSPHSQPLVRQSQDAAVGFLVHLLQTALPLRPDMSHHSSHSTKPEVEEGGIGAASGFYVPRKASDALEELRSYREMRDLLLSKSRTCVLDDEVAKKPIGLAGSSSS